uniref:Ribosomal protein L6 n=1 Tax=Physarum polycephalum TaxID=5791 RepID=F2Y9U4_PHYPO|nr:ribosomal protein L6 [Physarum polycephalum]
MIIASSYPLLQFNEINSIEGILSKQNLLLKSFLTKEPNSLFMAKKQNKLLSSSNIIKKKHNGFLIEILFHGFNFSAKRFKLARNKYFIDTHKSEVFICDEPVTSTFKSQVHKRRLIFFSYDNHLLHTLEKAIKQFKLPDSYTGKGLFERHDSYKIKQRKKRK